MRWLSGRGHHRRQPCCGCNDNRRVTLSWVQPSWRIGSVSAQPAMKQQVMTAAMSAAMTAAMRAAKKSPQPVNAAGNPGSHDDRSHQIATANLPAPPTQGSNHHPPAPADSLPGARIHRRAPPTTSRQRQHRADRATGRPARPLVPPAAFRPAAATARSAYTVGLMFSCRSREPSYFDPDTFLVTAPPACPAR